jgi:NADPH:quinone reductase-like Zn-dependent oxidoreductase
MSLSTEPNKTDPVEVVPTESGGNIVSIPTKMRAAVARSYGTPDVLAVEEVSVPNPGKGELLVKVETSSLNALDWHFLTGTPYLLRLVEGLRKPRRLIPGADVAGTVVAYAADVSGFEFGDHVFGECKGGGCSPYLIVRSETIVAKPDVVSFDAAGATGVAGLTAVQALRTHANVKPGDRVLVNGAAGGVGTFAVQIAKALGAEVTGVCSTLNVEMVRSLGADEVIDYTADDFVAGGARFDVMMDNVGNRTPADCLNVLVPEGRYVVVSGPKDNYWLDPMRHIARTWRAFRRASQSFHQFTADPNHEDLNYLGELLANGQLEPEIQRVIGIDEVAEGLAEIGTGHARAKIVVKPQP